MKKLNGVLLVDDDPTTNFYNKYLIEKMDLAENVFEAMNGEEALKLLHSNYKDINLIFLDINMPVMNGFEFLEEYVKLPEEIKTQLVVCMLTSSSLKYDMDKVSKFNVYSYLNKPLDEEKLRGIFEQVGQF